MGNLRSNSRDLATAMAVELLLRHPDWSSRLGGADSNRIPEEFEFHLRFLTAAAELRRPHLFGEYVQWAAGLAESSGVALDPLFDTLDVLRWVLRRELSVAEFAALYPSLETGFRQLSATRAPQENLLSTSPLQYLAAPFLEYLLRAESANASALILEAAHSGVPILDLYVHVFQCTQREIGRLWHLGQITVAQEHYCTSATQRTMAQLHPMMFPTPCNGRQLVAACAYGDPHDMGIRMVCEVLGSAGWETCYLGANTSTELLITEVKTRQADLVAISVTLAAHLGALRHAILTLRADPFCRSVPILVGGLPFNANPGLWSDVGADASARDASAVLPVASLLIAGRETAGSEKERLSC